MATSCENCPLRNTQAFVDFSADQLKFMQKFKVGELTVEPGTIVAMSGGNSPQLFTALSGMGTRFKSLPEGRRETVNFIFPGDFIGLQANVMDELKYSVEATTRMTLCVFNRSDFWTFSKNYPEAAYGMTWLSAVEEHFMGTAYGAVAQGTAVKIIAWALMRIFVRGSSLGMVQNNSMAFPFRQQDLADVLGLSLVHTNKTLATLRERGLVTWMNGEMIVSDLDALAQVAGTRNDPVMPRGIM
jgi:CRP-like cAMP-binding protein